MKRVLAFLTAITLTIGSASYANVKTSVTPYAPMNAYAAYDANNSSFLLQLEGGKQLTYRTVLLDESGELAAVKLVETGSVMKIPARETGHYLLVILDNNGDVLMRSILEAK